MNQSGKQKIQRVKELKHLIRGAARGDQKQIERLLSPFLLESETLKDCALTAKMGLIPTYDFAFLTDRRIGDLEITPLTGNLVVEVAFLHKIDAFSIIQPAFPILLRLFMFGLYFVPPLMAMSIVLSLGWLGLAIAACVVFLANLIVSCVINPVIRRMYLRFKKSGIVLAISGHFNTLIFADRNKFALLTRIASQLSEIKRQLDKELA